jgi:hypothetical protein
VTLPFRFSKYNVANHLTLCSTVIEKLTLTQLVKLPAFYGIRRFIIVFTTARHWSQSWARCIQSTPSHPTDLRSMLILSSHLLLGLPSGLFPSHSRPKLCISNLYHACYMSEMVEITMRPNHSAHSHNDSSTIILNYARTSVSLP